MLGVEPPFVLAPADDTTLTLRPARSVIATSCGSPAASHHINRWASRLTTVNSSATGRVTSVSARPALGAAAASLWCHVSASGPGRSRCASSTAALILEGS